MNTLQKLGYPDNTKLLIIHADDAGLCHAENLATIECLTHGHVNSFSIMAPCPGFEEMAAFAKQNEHLDQGVHLTLTCEWKNVKWGTTSPATKASSLLDANNHMYGSRDALKNSATVEELRTELKSQIEKAIRHGVKPTHLDSHMYTLGLKPEFIELYKSLGAEYRLPVLLNRKLIADYGINPNDCLTSDDFVADHVYFANYQDFQNGKLATFYEHTLNTLPSGLNILLIHPAFDNEEMQDITVDHPNFGSAWRQIDYEFFTSDKCKSLLEDNNIELITWKKIKTILYPS